MTLFFLGKNQGSRLLVNLFDLFGGMNPHSFMPDSNPKKNRTINVLILTYIIVGIHNNIRMNTICRIYILHVYQYNYIHIYSNHYIIGGIRLLGKYGQMVGSAVDFQAKCFSTCRTEKVE